MITPLRPVTIPHLLSDGRASGLGVTVTGIGHGTTQGRGTLKRRALDCYGLVHLYGGSGFFESASCPGTPLSAGDSFLLFPNEWHCYNPGENDSWAEYWFLFKGPFADFLVERRLLRSTTPVYRGAGIEKNILPLCREANALSKDTSPLARRRLPGLVLHILNEVFAVGPETPPATGADPIAAITRKLRENPLKEWDFEALARDHGIGFVLFRKRFAAQNGLPPYRFLLSERMRLASQWIAGGMRPFEAAEKAGMKDPYHFSRLFKNMTGVSPRNFQRFVRQG